MVLDDRDLKGLKGAGGITLDHPVANDTFECKASDAHSLTPVNRWCWELRGWSDYLMHPTMRIRTRAMLDL